MDSQFRSRGRLRRREDVPSSVQIDCALFPQGPGIPWYVPWRDLLDAVEQWRRECLFRQFFFTRKLPGLRMRFLGDGLDERLGPELVRWLDEAERSNAIRGYRFAIYEPEQARFGGPSGIDIAHDAFDRDSRLAMRYETLAAQEQAEVPRDVFSLLLVNDLCGRAVEDSSELWDIWQRLNRALGRNPHESHAGPQIDVSRTEAALSTPDAFLQQLPAAAGQLVRDGWQENAHVIARLRAAQAANRLSIGPRAWLASVCLFHWNRLAIEPAVLDALTARMVSILAPLEQRL
jgi:thiopeptide-type bacteriocin biosynthesis protein